MNKKNNCKKNQFKQKKDCCVQSLKDVNCFLSDYSKVKKAFKIFKWIK